MKAELELIKIHKHSFDAPELCIVNIRLSKVDTDYEQNFEVQTTGISNLRLTKHHNDFNLREIEILIDWLNTVSEDEVHKQKSSNRSRVYDFVKEKFKAHKQLNNNHIINNQSSERL